MLTSTFRVFRGGNKSKYQVAVLAGKAPFAVMDEEIVVLASSATLIMIAATVWVKRELKGAYNKMI